MKRTHTTALYVLRATLVLLVLFLVARSTLVTSYRVSGASMRSTLEDGDRILVCEVQGLIDPPEVGETVILDVHDEILVKRVIACPGDTISMFQGQVVRNGHYLREDIAEEFSRKDSFPDYTLARNEYFVLGDNRRVSIDSREFGPVTREQVVGRVIFRISTEGVSTVAALGR
jgi:signal peptidase I